MLSRKYQVLSLQTSLNGKLEEKNAFKHVNSKIMVIQQK